MSASTVLRGMAVQPLKRKALRYVEKQSQIATSELVDSAEEQLLLEQLLEQTKPPVAEDLQGLHWLLRSAFRYPPLQYGSRFGTAHERGILYLSESHTALTSELAFYAYQYVAGMAVPPPNPVRRDLTVIEVAVRTSRSIDITTVYKAAQATLCDPTSWVQSQTFGREARAVATTIRYPSARVTGNERVSGNAEAPTPVHANLAVLCPSAVQGNAHPVVRSGYTTLADAGGVRIQADWQPTQYFDAAQFAPAPF